MYNNLYNELIKSIQDIKDNLEKGRLMSGRYANTFENRKLGRVGQKYISKKEDDNVDKKLYDVQRNFGGKYSHIGINEKGLIEYDSNESVYSISLRISDHSAATSQYQASDLSFVITDNDPTKGRTAHDNIYLDTDLSSSEMINKIESISKNVLLREYKKYKDEKIRREKEEKEYEEKKDVYKKQREDKLKKDVIDFKNQYNNKDIDRLKNLIKQRDSVFGTPRSKEKRLNIEKEVFKIWDDEFNDIDKLIRILKNLNKINKSLEYDIIKALESDF